MGMDKHGKNEESENEENGTELLDLEDESSYQIQEQQSTEVLHLTEKNTSQSEEERETDVLGVSNEKSPVKATSMGRVMEVVSSLPGIDEGDDLWMDAYEFLAKSKAARELLVSRRVNPNVKVKWLEVQVKKFKK